MSISFYLKNPKKLFRAKPVLTVNECLRLSTQGIMQFTADEDKEGFDRKAFYALPLSELVCLLCGVVGQSGRGFDLSFDKEAQSYVVRVLTPSTLEDWRIALRYLKDLSTILGQPIESEHGDTFSAETIEQFDCKEDIRGGLQIFADQLRNDVETSTLYGIKRPVVINAALGQQILTATDPIAEFSHFYREIQWLNAYSANQKFFRKDDELLGVYALGYDVVTILPYVPSVEFEYSNEISDADVTRWVLFVVAGDNEHYELPYAQAMARLPREKYRFIDATYIQIDALNADELRALAAP